MIQITFRMALPACSSASLGEGAAITRFFYFVVLMLLSSSAQAGNSFSLVVGGHRIRIDAPRSCRSPSCVSVSIPGIYQTHRARERDDIDAASKPEKLTTARQTSSAPRS